jgi:hypothetical protein
MKGYFDWEDHLDIKKLDTMDEMYGCDYFIF